MTAQAYKGVLTPDQLDELTPFGVQFFMSYGYLPPMAGGDGEGDPEHEDHDAEVDEPEDDPEAEREGGGEDEDDDPSSEQRERAGLREDETVVSKSEFERLRRIAKDAEKRAKQAEREAVRRREQEQRDAGNWEELLRERDERIAEAEAEREAARLELDETMRNQRIATVASRLNFRDPLDVRHFLSEEETADEAATERACKRLMREKPYLVEARRSSGAPINGDGGTLTIEEIKRMSQDEVNQRWVEVQQAMAAQGGSK